MQTRWSATELMREQILHPWNRGHWDNFTIPSCQSIGYLIDWLDGRPAEHEADLVAIDDLRGSQVVAYAAALSGRHAGPKELWSDDSRYEYDHRAEYSPFYHAVVGYLEQDELPRAQEVYDRLTAIEPACMSAFCNMAELHRRAGAVVDSELMLREGLHRASLGGIRHGIPDAAWTAQFRCALARLGAETSERSDEVVALLSQGDAIDVGTKLAALRGSDSLWSDERQVEDEVGFAAHAAFARADLGQRIMLGGAMRHAGIRPLPPPAAHASFDEAMAARQALATATTKRWEEYRRSDRYPGKR